MPSGHLIDNEGIDKLRHDHETLRKRLIHLEQKYSGAVGAGVRQDNWVAQTTSVISPMAWNATTSLTELGSGTADLFYPVEDPDGVADKFVLYPVKIGGGMEEKVYSTNNIPIPAGAIVTVQRNFKSGIWMVPEMQTALAKAGASGVPARSGTTAGEGTVTIYYIHPTDADITSLTETVDVFNMSATAVAANAYITIKRINLNTNWIVDAEDCG